MKQAYLDNAATTPLHAQVREVMEAVLGEHFGNPSSLHRLGVEAEQILTRARQDVAAMLGAVPENIVFTAGGTEANNLAIKGCLRSRTRARLITSVTEHPSVREVYKGLEGAGWDVVWLPVDSSGIVDLAVLERALDRPTGLVSIMAVNNETGTRQPLAEISAIVRSKSAALIHVDAVQAPGKVEFDLGRLDVDMVSVSAHKIMGPKGAGALWLRRLDLVRPLWDGGGQERGVRPGTENVAAIAGFGRAARLVADNPHWRQRLQQIRDRFVRGLTELDCRVVSPPDGAPHIAAVVFSGFQGEVLLQTLSGKGIYVSTGAACAGKKGNLSHVAAALGLDQESIRGLLRFSFSPLTSDEEIDYALVGLRQVLDELAFIRGRSRRR